MGAALHAVLFIIPGPCLTLNLANFDDILVNHSVANNFKSVFVGAATYAHFSVNAEIDQTKHFGVYGSTALIDF